MRDALLTAIQVADLLNVHVTTVNKWFREGKIPGVVLNRGALRRCIRFRRADIDRLIAEGLEKRNETE